MKRKFVSAILVTLITTATLSMTAFAYGGDYYVYDPKTNLIRGMNIYDNNCKTIEEFCNRSGYISLGTGEVGQEAALAAFMQQTGATFDTGEIIDPVTLKTVYPSQKSSSASATTETPQPAAAEESTTETSTGEAAAFQAAAPAAVKEEDTKKEDTKAAEKKAKAEASHGPYDGITDEAKEAFVGFTSDGVENSCYINVNKDAENLVMPKDTVAYTKANREDGSVNLVDSNGELVVGFTFPQTEIAEDVDLKCDITVNDGVYDLAFEKESDPGSNVIVKLPLSERNTTYHVYDAEGKSLIDVTTDDDGYAEFAVMTLNKYQITTGDYVDEAVPISEAEVEEETEETPVTEELTEETSQETVEEEAAATETAMPEVAETPAAGQTSLLSYVPIILAVVIAAIAAACFFIFKKK